MGRVLVACPTHWGKEYALEEWASAYQAFTYPDREAFMVDNTDGTLAYLHTLHRAGVPARWLRRLPSFWDTIELCYWRILERARERGCSHVCSIEADVICPPETLDVMLAHLGSDSLVSHRVPWRGPGSDGSGSGCWSIGCALVTLGRLERTLETIADHIEGALFSPPGVELDGLLDIRHLWSERDSEWDGGGEGK